jgi:hypothetical protein
MNDLIAMLDEADLSANVWRTAVRLARLANGFGAVVLTYEQLRAIVGTESDGTARAHLIKLHDAGVLWYRRNAVVSVTFYTPQTRARRAPDAQIDHDVITDEDDERAPDAQIDHETRALTENDDTERAPDDQIDHDTRTARATRAKRAPDDHYKVGRLVGRQVDLKPTNLPGGSGGKPLTADQQRTLAFLTDEEFGMDAATAEGIARRHAFEQVTAHAFAVLDDIRAGKVRGVYVLASRLSRGGMPQITPADRETSLWLRHCDEADDLRSRYIPDGYEGVILG